MKPKITLLNFILVVGMSQAQIDLNNGLAVFYPFIKIVSKSDLFDKKLT